MGRTSKAKKVEHPSGALHVGNVIEIPGAGGTPRQGEIRAVLSDPDVARYRVRWHDQHESIVAAGDDIVAVPQ